MKSRVVGVSVMSMAMLGVGVGQAASRIGAAAAVTQVAPASVAAGTADTEFNAMTLEQRVGQLFMVGGSANGVSSATRDAVTRYHVGSVVLTGRSTQGIAATRSISAGLQQLATSSATARVPLFIATDQEGGAVQVLQSGGFSRMPSALTQGTWATSTLTANATVWGRQLKSAGVNVNLAPVMDTVTAAFAPYNMPIGYYHREFGHTSSVVATKGSAFLDGMRAAGVATSIKHFPGLGRVTGNTDTTSGVTDSITTRTSAYLNPFRAGIAHKTAMVMMSTAFYSKIDPAHPAAFSPTIINGLLRHDLGFNGVVISDDLGAAKQVQRWSPASRAVTFISSGGDIVLTGDTAVVPAMVNAVVAKARTDASFLAKVNASALRVLRAKQAQGLTATTRAPLVVDGVLGPLTTKAIQSWVDTTQDGLLGPITYRALQRRVGTIADGIWGPASMAALQRFLHITTDGARSWNARTIRALQSYLNTLA